MLIFVKLIFVFFSFFLFYLGIPAIVKIMLRRQFLLKVKRDNSLYLTFDDGPNPEATPMLLDILSSYGVKATFFVTGEMTEKFPEIVRRIIEEGHELGGHSYSHCHPWKTDPFTSLIDMVKGTNIIRAYIVDRKPMLFRPPYGKFNFVTLLYVFITKQKVVFWNNDPKDYLSDKPEQVVTEIFQNINEKKVILMHDGGAVDSWIVRKNVTAISVYILLNILKNKYDFKTIGEIIDY